MSINTREDANKYYQLINGLIDNYIDNHKIRPSRLKTYLKPGGQRFNKFLERKRDIGGEYIRLKDIKGSEIILKDIIEDREHMEKDGVYKFESFSLLESTEYKVSNLRQCIYKGIEKADIKMEKILADYFDINLGAIDIVDSDKHKFRIEDWKNDDWRVVIYSSEDVEVIKSNLIEYFYEELINKEIELVDKIKINLDKLISEEKFSEMMEEKISEKELIKIIADCLGEDWGFESEFRGFFIWVC